MIKLYIAGAMSSSDPVVFLENLRRGMRVSTEAVLAGFAVFSPFIDYSLFFQCRDGEAITGAMIKASSMAWLEVADAVLVAPGWEDSVGTKAEIARATVLQKPVYFYDQDCHICVFDDMKRELNKGMVYR